MKPNAKPSSDNHTSLFRIIFQRIKKNASAISFAEFMDLALYHSEFGYYSQISERRIGREGDFYTSVSVGDTYGEILSHWIEEKWRCMKSPSRFCVVEQGGHDGQLARDILAALNRRDCLLGEEKFTYYLIEPRASLRQTLANQLEEHSRIRVISSVAEVGNPEYGVFLCNELFDALPVVRLIFHDGLWHEWGVAISSEFDAKLDWETLPIAEEHSSFVEEIESYTGSPPPDDYKTEICPALRDWISGMASLFGKEGRWLFVDYGHESADYFSPLRREGTLRCYLRHRASEDPFSHLGDTDLTAHVNLSHLIRWSEEEGLSLVQLTDQHRFLIESARSWLQEWEKSADPGDALFQKKMRQFQTLTHPSLMGQAFKVVEFASGSEYLD